MLVRGKRSGSTDGTVFGKLDESRCLRAEVMPTIET